MSTIKSSDEHLTLNADGSSKDIKFQANGVEKASISSSGAFTSTTIDATKLTGTIPNFTSTGIDDNADATAITIDSSENVAIGHTSTTGSKFAICDGADSQIQFFPEISTDTNLTQHYDPTATAYINAETRAASHSFKIGTTERTSIDTNGLSIGTYANPPSSSFIRLTSAGIVQSGRTGTGNQPAVEFFNGNGVVGSIYTGGTTTTYYTSSDYRLKENVNYDWDATTRLKQLKPARFNFIADDSVTFDGFLAHEVQDIVPEAIGGEKDGMTPEVLYKEGDEIPEGKSVGDVKTASEPDYQGIDQSKLVPLLVKTIQELEARIAALEA